MKKRILWLRYLFIFLAFASASVAYAQEITVTGKVKDAADGSSIPGAAIVVKSTTIGTVTDIDGNYTIKVQPGAILVFSYMGYQTQEVPVAGKQVINISLVASVTSLNEVVVIGYGTVKKQDATGSVSAINNKDFNQGAIASPQQLVIGKIAGVQVTTLGGAPGGDAVIRIRGGASINASNDPLVVIDGVPIDNSATSGARGSLSMINPDDIETYTVLKDASATAIYGSRASNGVIIITTKKGKAVAAGGTKKFVHEYSGNISIYTVPKTVSVLDGNTFRALVKQKYPTDTGLLGTANTDWQKQIFRTGISTDHNFSFYGGLKYLPYRVSLGYMYQDGILKTDNMKRTSIGVNLNPSFFEDHLKINANAKYMAIENRFADQGAIGDAIAFDPTQWVNNYKNTSGYYMWAQANGTPVTQATTNPVALLDLKQDKAKVDRFLGNIQLDYKLHFFPDLRAVLNLGIDHTKANGTVYIPEYASWLYTDKGEDNRYSQTKNNYVLDFYLNYVKDVKSIKSKFDVMAGYSWQNFYVANTNINNNVPHDTAHANNIVHKKQYYLVSFYGRLNYTLMNRYLLTFTLRDDGSSKFSSDTRWGLFPSAALAWKINDEAFLRNSKAVSQLKLRVGWGETGQQDITDNWYPYLPLYTLSDQYTKYQFGNVWYYTLRPEGYDSKIKWETTATTNVGIDFGFLKDRITGSLEYYFKKTTDLLNYIPVPAGTNLSNYIWTNIGDMQNSGVEVSLDLKPVVTHDWNWDIGGNVAINKNKITKLTATDNPNYPGVLVGGISGGVGNTVQVQSVGYPMYSFYVYQQVYDANGKPIEGLYVDRNGDGKITDADRYRYKSANPDATFGVFSTLKYKQWTLSAAGHASVGNYMYDNIAANRGVYNNLYRPEGPYLGNVTTSVYDVNFTNQQYLSDYYVKNASFFKLDYLTLSYSFGNVIKNTTDLRLSFTVNNVFTITKYKGVDPEINTGGTGSGASVGIDNNVYPRSRVFVLGVNLLF
ncbi:MAG: TonB-dependent receptor [Bacteroidales bacterium]|jgi:iron complex outermembrane receptor protein